MIDNREADVAVTVCNKTWRGTLGMRRLVLIKSLHGLFRRRRGEGLFSF